MLNDLEQEVMRTRIQGWTITKQCMEYGLSRSSLNELIRKLKLKYDSVQPYSEILPVRRTSKSEQWQDTH